MKNIRLIFLFYKYIANVSFLINITSLSIIYSNGFSIISFIFFFKFFLSILVVFFINSSKANEFYYFYNLGLSKTVLWSSALFIDYFVFFVSLIIMYKFTM